MKKVSFLINALLICFFFTEASAQKYVTTTRQVSGFNAVTISGGIDLYITQGNSTSVKIEAANDIQKNIITEVHNGTLEIFYKSNDILRFAFRSNKMKAHVILPSLTNIIASGGSDVFSQNVWKIKELKMTASGGSDIKFELIGGKLECNASGGSDLTLRGKVSTLITTASGGSDVDAKDLQAIKVNTTASGGSYISIFVTTDLEASANGGSDIYYKGNPTKVLKNSSGGSDITKKD